jgi:CRISP-associated protein Cas1
MSRMWWKAESAALARMGDRVSVVYVERAVVGREDNAVTLLDADGETHLPAAMVGSLMLGPGTKLTHNAMRLLADSGTSVCWTGENGVRMYAHGFSNAQTSRYLQRQAWLVSDTKRRLTVAREMYGMRFPGEDVSKMSMQQLRGREGARVRRSYQLHSSRTGVTWQGRRYVAGKPFAAGDDVNRVLSALNACLYGVCHAATVGLGASPALGFVHTGSAISFVLDVADLYKALTTIPAAFDLVAEGAVEETAARTRFRDLVVEQGLMARVVRDIQGLLLGKEALAEDVVDVEKLVDDDGADVRRASLYGDGEDDLVPAGLNWERAADWPQTEVDLDKVDWSELDAPPVDEPVGHLDPSEIEEAP